MHTLSFLFAEWDSQVLGRAERLGGGESNCPSLPFPHCHPSA